MHLPLSIPPGIFQNNRRRVWKFARGIIRFDPSNFGFFEVSIIVRISNIPYIPSPSLNPFPLISIKLRFDWKALSFIFCKYFFFFCFSCAFAESVHWISIKHRRNVLSVQPMKRVWRFTIRNRIREPRSMANRIMEGRNPRYSELARESFLPTIFYRFFSF